MKLSLPGYCFLQRSMTQSLVRPSAYTAKRLDDSMEAYYLLNLEETIQNINRVLQEQGLA